MELTIKREEILDGLARSQSIVEKRSSMPILSNILLKAEEDSVVIIATDLDISFQGRFPAEIKSPGELTVPAKKFYEVIQALASDEVHLTDKENNYIQIKGGGYHGELVGLSSEDFPSVAAIEGLEYVPVSAAVLKDMIGKTSYAVSTEDTRYNLAGLFWEEYDDEGTKILRMVATDGHRLSLCDQSIEDVEKLNLGKGIILPRKGVHELSRMVDRAAKEEEALIEIAFGDKACIARYDDMILMMSLVDGTFPDYKLVIPKKQDIDVSVDRMTFIDILRRVSVLATDKYRGIKFKLTPGLLEIISSNPDVGEAKESLEVGFEGEEIVIGFNPRYFIELLTMMASEEVTIKLVDDSSPATIVGNGDPGFLSVIMPMRI